MPEEVRIKAELTVVLVFFLALAGIGAFVGGYAVQDFARARASLTWPTVNAIVLSASEREGRALRYAYVVDGRSYESKRAHFFVGKFGGEGREYRPGETIRVLVDPNDSALSVIRPGGSGWVFLATLAVAGVLLFFGVGGLIRTLMIAQAEGDRAGYPNGETGAV